MALLPDPEPIRLRGPINWLVVTPGNLPAGDDWVVIGVTARDYQILAENEAEKLRWTLEAQDRLQHYRERLTNGSR